MKKLKELSLSLDRLTPDHLDFLEKLFNQTSNTKQKQELLQDIKNIEDLLDEALNLYEKYKRKESR